MKTIEIQSYYMRLYFKLSYWEVIHNCSFTFIIHRLRLFGHFPCSYVQYLVQCCLGNRVVFDAEPFFIGHHQLKYSGKGGGGYLILQRVVVLLPLNTAGERALDEALDRLQIWGQARFSCLDFHSHDVAVTKSGSRKCSVKILDIFQDTFQFSYTDCGFTYSSSASIILLLLY